MKVVQSHKNNAANFLAYSKMLDKNTNILQKLLTVSILELIFHSAYAYFSLYLKKMTYVHKNDIKDSFWHFCWVCSFITLLVIEYAMLFLWNQDHQNCQVSDVWSFPLYAKQSVSKCISLVNSMLTAQFFGVLCTLIIYTLTPRVQHQ